MNRQSGAKIIQREGIWKKEEEWQQKSYYKWLDFWKGRDILDWKWHNRISQFFILHFAHAIHSSTTQPYNLTINSQPDCDSSGARINYLFIRERLLNPFFGNSILEDSELASFQYSNHNLIVLKFKVFQNLTNVIAWSIIKHPWCTTSPKQKEKKDRRLSLQKNPIE